MMEEELKYMIEEFRTASSNRQAELIFNRIYEKFKPDFKRIIVSRINSLRSYQIDPDDIIYSSFFFLWDKRNDEILGESDSIVPLIKNRIKQEIDDQASILEGKPPYRLYDPTAKYNVPSYYDEEKEIPKALIQYPNQENNIDREEIILMVSDQFRFLGFTEKDRKVLHEYWNFIASPKSFGFSLSEKSTLLGKIYRLNKKLRSRPIPFKNFKTLFEFILNEIPLDDISYGKLELGSTISSNTIINAEKIIQNQFGSELKWKSINRAIWNRLMDFETLDLAHASKIAESNSIKIEDVLTLLSLLSNPAFNLLKQVYYLKNSKPHKIYISSDEVAQKMKNWQVSKAISDNEWKDWSTAIMIGWETGNVDSIQKLEVNLN